MRDDSHKWDAPVETDAVHVARDLTITRVYPARQILVSGVHARGSCSLPLVGWPDPVSGTAFALVLRRDRVLEINGDPRPDGWDEATGHAVSDMTDGYAVFELHGPNAHDLLKRGGFVDLGKPSPSVSRLLFGLPSLLYRRNAPDHFALHVSRAHAQALHLALISTLENI